ncbi:MAG: DoxX family protein [Solirubrobacteraceae bacterium]
MPPGKLALRVTLGSLFIGHGTQKLFGWFGGHGIEGTGGFFESLGLPASSRFPSRKREVRVSSTLTDLPLRFRTRAWGDERAHARTVSP